MSDATGVLVLGGSGFIGSAVMRALAAIPGIRPISAQRRPPDRALAWESRVCDVDRPASMASALQGVSAAVNVVLGGRDTMLGAARLLGAADLSRVVHVSTMSVYGPACGLLDETAVLDGSVSRYGQSKVDCERIAASPRTTILRPGIVYGPGGEQWIGRPCRLLRTHRLGNLGAAGEGFANLIHVDDVAAAVAAALTSPHTAGEAINLATPTPMRWNAFFALLAGALRIVARPIGRSRLAVEGRVLAPVLQAAKLAAAKAGLRPGTLPEPMPASLLRLFGQAIRLDHGKADRLLRLARTPDEAGILAAVASFQPDAGSMTRGRR